MSNVSPLLANLDQASPTKDKEQQPKLEMATQSFLPSPAMDMTRLVGDPDAAREAIYASVLNAAQTLPPVSNGRYTLALRDAHYADPPTYSRKEQKQAILDRRSLGRRLRGTWLLTDAEGNVLDKRSTVARIPTLTDRHTFIHNGNEYTLSSQTRLRPGVYSRIKSNGEYETHVNALSGKGQTHHYFLDPASGVFYTKVRQAKIPLMPLLKTLGVTDKQLQAAWGPQVFAANLQADSPSLRKKYYERFLSSRERREFQDDLDEGLRRAIANTELDPEVTERTLGKPYDRLSGEAIVAASSKLLKLARGEAEVDDRDDLAFQTVHGPEDLFAERLSRDWGGYRAALLRKVSRQGSLKSIAANALGRQVEAALLQSGLGMALEENNLAEIYDKHSKVTRMGEGGIGSLDAIPTEARSVQPSHLGFIDPARTPESLRIGVDVHFSAKVRKGKDNRLYAPFKHPKTGEISYVSPQELKHKAIAFAGEMENDEPYAWVMRDGQFEPVPKDKVDLVLPDMEGAFSPLSNLIPMKRHIVAQRLSMGSRMLTQALALKDAEAPLVQAAVPGNPDVSFEELYGKHMGAVYADKPARVVGVSAEGITLRDADGQENTIELYDRFPFNRRSFVTQTPLVRVGDVVQPGQILAKSNQTNDRGAIALGKNARVAYMAYKGLNFEDAIVVSESFAKNLTSERLYPYRLKKTPQHVVDKNKFLSLFASKYSKEQLAKIGPDGVILPGTPVEPGDPLVLAFKETEVNESKLLKKTSRSQADDSIVWEHDAPGVISDISNTKRGVSIHVASSHPLEVADKISFRYGDKSVVSKIVPDEEMPQDAQGQPFDVIANPHAVISRGNVAQVFETILGKIAAVTGEPIKVPDFSDSNLGDMWKYVDKKMKEAGLQLKDLEDVVDPLTQRKIRAVLTGNRWVMKLQHTAEGKLAGRGTASYTQDETPARGGAEGSKRVSLLDTAAILAHGSTGVLEDAKTVRGQRNDAYWLQFLQGYTPDKPRVPFVYEKFVNSLRGAGINVVPEGRYTHIMGMTSKNVRELAGDREITSGMTVDFDKGLKPVKGGLFDPAATGGHRGDKWSFIRLAAPMPNPVMEEPIRALLGLTAKQFQATLAGQHSLPGVGTGPLAIQKALQRIDLNKEVQAAERAVKTARKAERDRAIRRLSFLRSAVKNNQHPQDWVWDRVPVLPPKFRPVSLMGGTQQPLVADANYLYKDLLDTNDVLKQLSQTVDDTSNETLSLYQAVKAVTGLGEPVPTKLQEKRVKGFLSQIIGTGGPKTGMMQRKLLSTPVDLVGRGVVRPDPDLDMDSVSIPEDKAWEIYSKFVGRRLVRRGSSPLEALQKLKNRTADARNELLAEMEARPIILNRAPVLHKFGVLALKPRLTKHKSIGVSPLIVSGLGMDFDGDAAQFHVPGTDKARDEALQLMLPSQGLIRPHDMRNAAHGFSQEYIAGLAAATSAPKKGAREFVFRSAKEAVQALKRGDIHYDDVVVVQEN